MSSYGKMQASPFWRRVMGVTALIFLITLVTPTGYYLKYLIFDSPAEQHVETVALTHPLISPPTSVLYVDYYTKLTESPDKNERLAGVRALGAMVLLPHAQVTHPIECLHAKLAIEQVIETDKDPAVHAAAMDTLLLVAAHGAVIKR